MPPHWQIDAPDTKKNDEPSGVFGVLQNGPGRAPLETKPLTRPSDEVAEKTHDERTRPSIAASSWLIIPNSHIR